MNAEAIQKIITHYGYGKSTLDSIVENTFYFRTNDYKYVIRVTVSGNKVDIDRANEDFYEKYPIDFYFFTPDAMFTFDELIKDGWINKDEVN